MSLKIGLWCPHGRDGLPLAARLLLEQLPENMVVWSSDAAAPDAPGPDVPGCDLWLVLCAGAPPAPPPWLASAGGRRAVLPGTSVSWGEATAASLASWEGAVVLTDLLPDETGNGLPRTMFDDGRAMAWLPAVGSEAFLEPRHSDPVTVLGGGDVMQWLEARRALPVGQRVMLLPCDPVIVGIVSRAASEHGVAASVLGGGASLARTWMLGGAPVVVKRDDRQAGRSELRARMGELLQTPLRPQRKAAKLHWCDWVAGLADPTATGRGLGGKAAGFLRENQRRRRSAASRPGADAGRSSDPRLPFMVYPELVKDPEAVELVAACPPDGWWFEHVGVHVAADGSWIEAALQRAEDARSPAMARLLWYAVCDSYRSPATLRVTEAIGQLVAGPGYEWGDLADWEIGRVLVLAATGHFEAARDELDRLWRSCPANVVPALQWILRAWAPAYLRGEADLVPQDGVAWWRTQAGRCLSARMPGARIACALGELRFGEPAGALALVEGSDEPTPAQRALFAVEACARGAWEVARAAWLRAAEGAPSDAFDDRFALTVARAILGSGEPGLATVLGKFARERPSFFAAERPSHPRCALMASALRRVGAAEEAMEWERRSEEQDPFSAEHRVPE
jgi:hypothetical protein